MHDAHAKPSRRILVLTLCSAIIVFMSVSAGCVPQRQAGPSAPGDYASGARLVLDDGGSLSVPKGWSAQVNAPGALITTRPVIAADTDDFGGLMTLGEQGIRGIRFTVYDPGSRYSFQMTEDLWSWRTGGGVVETSSSGVSPLRTTLRLDASTVATAYISPLRSGGCLIDIAVQGRGNPVLIVADYPTLPAELVDMPESEWPRFVLDLVQFKPR